MGSSAKFAEPLIQKKNNNGPLVALAEFSKSS